VSIRFGTKSTKRSKDIQVGVLIDVAVSYRIGSERFLSDIVAAIKSALADGKLDNRELSQTAQELSRAGLLDKSELEALLVEIKDYLLKNSHYVQDLEPFCDFKEAFPKLIDKTDLTRARNVFGTAIENELDSSDDDPDMWGQLVYDIKGVAAELGVNKDAVIEKIENKISELEEEAAEIARNALAEIGNDPDDTRKDEGEIFTDVDLTSMFQSLKE